jgi:alpha-D-ribose 1-methylphosphonate 5-triphosphate synthase subunit PhnL
MLQCKNLKKEFLMHIRGGKRITGLRDVSFELEEGTFLGVSGPSGSGKSSLLKCIYRTYIPTDGELLYSSADGTWTDLATAEEHRILELRNREIGYISQFFHVIPRVSALDTVVKQMRRKGYTTQESTARAQELLQKLGLSPSLWELFPSTFSGGEQQRVNIIHAVITKPRLLLLDESTSSLDARSAEAVIRLIKELQSEGTAIIGVFHDKKLLARLADKTLSMGEENPR